MSDDNHKHREITIETLSAPPIRIVPAPLGLRAIAGLMDSLILATLWLIFSILLGQSPMQFIAFANYFALALLALLTFIYYFVQEGLFSGTIGKSVAKLEVLQTSGDQCSFRTSIIRNVLRFVDWLPVLYLIGLIAVTTSADRRRIGDRFANTIVTKKPPKDPNPPPAPFLFH
jgi:uncharacterized RDD family membrane protein YckC